MTVASYVKKGSILIVMALSTASCSWLKQPAAPVEQTQPDATVPSYNTGGSQPSGSTDNAYSPPTSGSYTGGTSSGTYIPSNAPVDINAKVHTVVAGDTLYNISKRYGVPQDSIIAWNNMPDITVRLGQNLYVKPPQGGSSVTAATGTASSTATATKPTTVDDTPKGTGNVNWVVPTQGTVITRFTDANKGVDIAGTKGQPVVAASAGKVVYSGNGLRGYGNLIIIQHNTTYLSAYAHNQTLLVKEGQNVTKGQKIAEMGNSDADRVKLHFEIRKQGKPVDPSQFVKF
ncbi:peptidoglycan DD-metalloendopeptidase family protein [Neisseria sp. Ec49-e6-T10]|uniref:peptidoglycan DD-metalloendopeptidase family protein n=1 Tax=Neisseria sp. Ec49-e6-T10 TaxID=3140744 RepID=UPI003EBBD6AA